MQPLHIFYLAIYLPYVSLSSCIYNESYIYVTTSDYPAYNGAYIRNLTTGILTQNPENKFLPPNCGKIDLTFNPIVYNGTYIYETQNEPKKYLWMFHDSGGNGLKIGTEICDPDYVVFETLSGDTSSILDGVNCDWASIDSDNSITWREIAGEQAVSGTFVLCDSTEACFTPDPTSAPTLSPVPTTEAPTVTPTTAEPTTNPTDSTGTPSKTPTKSPTVKPTPLPTTTVPLYVDPPCVALAVTNLDKAFPLQADYFERFNEYAIYNQRRVWYNGANRLEIFYTDRYDPNRWVISNGTYHLINDAQHLVHGGVNNSLPANDDGYGLYDHFPNDNIYKLAESKYTLTFVCQNTTNLGTKFPTKEPSPSPSSAPSFSPSTAPSLAPSFAPTVTCGTLFFEYGKQSGGAIMSDCDKTVQFQTQFLAQQDDTFNNHSWWRNYLKGRPDEKLFYSNMWDGWIFNMEGEQGNVGHHSVYISAERGLEMPPVNGTWLYFDHGDIHSPHCSVKVELSCTAMLPTEQPSSDNPTPSPTSAPSDSPTFSPSGSPSQPPSIAPSQPPSVAPTFAPTLLCGGLAVDIEYAPIEGINDDYAYFTGNYRRQDDDDLIHDKYWWLSRDVAGSTIFYSDVVFHNSWVIQSLDAESYWLYPEFNPYSHWLQPPLFGIWQYYTPMSPFPLDRRNITLHCTYSLLPTPAPSLAPSIAPTSPPTNAPSIAPTLAPSVAPTIAPSLAPTTAPTTPAPSAAPSLAPSLAPTQPPTREACAWMQVSADSELLGQYEGIYDTIEGGRNGFAAWIFANENGVFIIEKTSDGLYWSINKQDGGSLSITDMVTMDNAYNWRPPEFGDWLFWKIRPNPTTAPTQPTFEPTRNPSVEPTIEPSMDPTSDPSMDPTSDPTDDPTVDPTVDPSMDPSIDPTYDPTLEPTIPTMDPTYFPSEDPTLDPTLEPTEVTDIPTKAPTNDPTEPTNVPTATPTITTNEPTYIPTLQPTQDPTHEPTFEPTRDPTEGPTFEPTIEPTSYPTAPTPGRRRSLLQDPPQGTQVYGDRYKITMDCVNTGAPTMKPTTAKPTMAPTSVCHSILITSANNSIYTDLFPYYGKYIRWKSYTIDTLYWFLSVDGLSSLKYIHGSWQIYREDRNDGDDEDPIAIYRNATHPNPLKWLLLSPQNIAWYLMEHDTDIYLNINCLDSTPPTPAPTALPTDAPTKETNPVWIDCKRNWFTFISDMHESEINDTYGVYWNTPKARGEDTDDVKVEIVNNASIQEGDELNIGLYTILYRATNIYNGINDSDALYSDCEVNLYVIGHTQSATADYCISHKFSVNIQFNETYHEILKADDDDDDDDDDDIKYEMDSILNIKGFATNPELEEKTVNCYIFASQIVNFTTIVVKDKGPTKAFLGIELQAIIWDILILLMVCCICGLCIYRLRNWHKQRKENRDQPDSKAALLGDGALERERVASAEQDDDDLDLDGIPANETQPGSTRHILKKKKSKKEDELLAAEPGQSEYKPPEMLSDAEINRNETAAGVDGAIDVLIGEAFDKNVSDPILVTPDAHPKKVDQYAYAYIYDKKGGDIELQAQKSVPLHPPPLGIRQSTFDDGGTLPDEPAPSDPMISEPVLVTPENMPIVDEEIIPVPSKVAHLAKEPAAYQMVGDGSTGALHQDAALMNDPQDMQHPASNDEYAELEESDDDDDDDDSEFEFRV